MVGTEGRENIAGQPHCLWVTRQKMRKTRATVNRGSKATVKLLCSHIDFHWHTSENGE